MPQTNAGKFMGDYFNRIRPAMTFKTGFYFLGAGLLLLATSVIAEAVCGYSASCF